MPHLVHGVKKISSKRPYLCDSADRPIVFGAHAFYVTTTVSCCVLGWCLLRLCQSITSPAGVSSELADLNLTLRLLNGPTDGTVKEVKGLVQRLKATGTSQFCK